MSKKSPSQVAAVISAVWVMLSILTDLVKIMKELGLNIQQVGESFYSLAQTEGESARRQIAGIIAGAISDEIDTDVDPLLPFSGATIERHVRVGKVKIELRADGCLYIGGKKVILYRSERQMNDQVINGHELRTKVDGKLVLSASILDFLMSHQEFIPEGWKKDENGKTIYIVFWGTVFRGAVGGLYVRYLYWDEGAWREGCGWLDDDWYSKGPAAVCASN